MGLGSGSLGGRADASRNMLAIGDKAYDGAATAEFGVGGCPGSRRENSSSTAAARTVWVPITTLEILGYLAGSYPLSSSQVSLLNVVLKILGTDTPDIPPTELESTQLTRLQQLADSRDPNS